MSIVTKDSPSVALDFTGLMDGAKENRAALQNRRRDIVALAKTAGLETLGNVSAVAQPSGQRYPLVIGQPVTHEIPFGQLTSGGKTIGLNLIPDFLRYNSGEIATLKGEEAVEAITALNGGLKYGNGFEKDTARAIAKGEFEDGTLFLARQEDLLKIARERKTIPGLEQMNKIIAGGSFGDSWCVSSTEGPHGASSVYSVCLKGRDPDLYHNYSFRGCVVALRGVALG